MTTATTTDRNAERAATMRDLREGLGVTQAELAKRLDVAMNTVWRWETYGAPRTVEYAVRYLLTLEKRS